MQSVQSALFLILAGIMVALIVRVLVWCLVDVTRDALDVDSNTRTLWVVALLVFSVVSVPLYVGIGPGRYRWMDHPPWPWGR